MELYEALRLVYPDEDVIHGVVIADDGLGPYIVEWHLDLPQPSIEELYVVVDRIQKEALEVREKTDFEERNRRVVAQLNELDLASIRPLREKDDARIAELNKQADELRAKLEKL